MEPDDHGRGPSDDDWSDKQTSRQVARYFIIGDANSERSLVIPHDRRTGEMGRVRRNSYDVMTYLLERGSSGY